MIREEQKLKAEQVHDAEKAAPRSNAPLTTMGRPHATNHAMD